MLKNVTRNGVVKVMRFEVVVGLPTVKVVLEKNARFRLVVYAGEDIVVERVFNDVDAAFAAYRAAKGELCAQAEAVKAALKRVANTLAPEET